MADLDNLQDGKNYYLDIPQRVIPSRIKGSNALDWGMKNRLARIFDPDDSRTVMLAIDHGYFQGPTTGLERIDITIVPLDRLCRRSHGDAGRLAQHNSRGDREAGCAALERRPKHPQRAIERIGRGRYR